MAAVRTHVLLLAALLVSGCSQAPGSTSDPPESPSPAGSTSAPPASPSPNGSVSPPPGTDVVLAGQIHRYRQGFLVNVTAHNVGTRNLGWSAPFCASPPGWTAKLSGPPGDDLVYRHGDITMGCPAKAGEMPPGTWLNWTWPYWDSPCNTDTVCDNIWDGTLRECDGCSPADDPRPAPPGTYTWTFTFSYQDRPAGIGTGQSANPGAPWHEVSISFEVDID